MYLLITQIFQEGAFFKLEWPTTNSVSSQKGKNLDIISLNPPSFPVINNNFFFINNNYKLLILCNNFILVVKGGR